MRPELRPELPPAMQPDLPAGFDCDVLVIGSGAGGLSAAVSAAHLGLKVIVLEKEAQYGGTTAWSGGWMWLPRNPLAQEAGLVEDIATPLSYLRQELGAQFDAAQALAFLHAAPQMVEFFRRHTALQFVDGNRIPDFHGHTPDAALGGRSICAAPFDARRLGARLADLKPPLPETTLWGMGIASGLELRHFLQATRSLASFVYVAKRVLGYARDRLLHGHGLRRVNGNALVAALAASAFEKGVEIRTRSPAKSLLFESGRVVGAVLGGAAQGGAAQGAAVQGAVASLRARCGVVLACGGFPHDTQRKKALLPHAPSGAEHWSAAARGNTGDGLRLGEAVGAVVAQDLVQAAALAPVSLVPHPDGSFSHFPHLLERAKPGLMAVDAQGQRFTNEADSYHDFMQGLLRATPAGHTLQAWLVCDHAFIRRYGLGAVKPRPMPLGAMLANGYLLRGQTLEALARACGIDAAGLQASVRRYNAMAQAGVDADFAKGQTPYNRIQGDAALTAALGLHNPCMAPLHQGPFYAVRIVPGSLGTFAGLRVNTQAQVLDAQGQVIAGLYAAGNDMNSIMGGHYPSGGITLGPAMTFGYIAAHAAAGQPLPSAFHRLPTPSSRNTMYYELATMTLPFGTAAQAALNVQAYATAPQAQGELLGCWFTDIGVLNQMIVLRGFADLAQLQAERARTQHSASPFGCGDIYQTLEQHSYQGFPWMKPVRPSAETGIQGPVYEIRTYGIKSGGVQATIDLWEQAVPAREALSPCVLAMLALDGPLRFTNIWSYPTLDARSKARADAVAQGIWPPKGGPAHLTTQMVSTIAMPTAVSPLK